MTLTKEANVMGSAYLTYHAKLESKLNDLTSLVKLMALYHRATKLHGICTFIDHPTNFYLTLHEYEGVFSLLTLVMVNNMNFQQRTKVTTQCRKSYWSNGHMSKSIFVSRCNQASGTNNHKPKKNVSAITLKLGKSVQTPNNRTNTTLGIQYNIRRCDGK